MRWVPICAGGQHVIYVMPHSPESPCQRVNAPLPRIRDAALRLRVPERKKDCIAHASRDPNYYRSSVDEAISR